MGDFRQVKSIWKETEKYMVEEGQLLKCPRNFQNWEVVIGVPKRKSNITSL